MSTSPPRRTGGRTLIDLDPGQLKWILLARESTDRERQLDHQLTDLRARVASIGGTVDREIPENDVAAFKRKRVQLPDGTFGFRVVRPEWEKILTALRRGERRDSSAASAPASFRAGTPIREGWSAGTGPPKIV